MEVVEKDSPYNDDFYHCYMDRSYRSAQKYVKFLLTIYSPKSVADIGCGRGAWLKAFHENGVNLVVGYDGEWNSGKKMIDKAIVFREINLNKPDFEIQEKFDLVVSLEVAEHLDKASAANFVRSISTLSDIAMFSAAFIKQGGTDHLNEQPHTYWAKLFIDEGFHPYDLFRPIFWGDTDVDYWYQQNTFLYVKADSKVNILLRQHGYEPIKNIKFMDCVHPSLYLERLSDQELNVKRMLHLVLPSPIVAVARKCKRVLRWLVSIGVRRRDQD